MRTDRRDDDVDGILGRALDEGASAPRVGQILDGPLSGDRLPAIERLAEIEAALRTGRRGGAPDRQTGPQSGRGGDEFASRCAHDRSPWIGSRPPLLSKRRRKPESMARQLLATFTLSSAARRPVASLCASSFAQKCMKKRRGGSFHLWVLSRGPTVARCCQGPAR